MGPLANITFIQPPRPLRTLNQERSSDESQAPDVSRRSPRKIRRGVDALA
jgi:hypothetical protein